VHRAEFDQRRGWSVRERMPGAGGRAREGSGSFTVVGVDEIARAAAARRS